MSEMLDQTFGNEGSNTAKNPASVEKNTQAETLEAQSCSNETTGIDRDDVEFYDTIESSEQGEATTEVQSEFQYTKDINESMLAKEEGNNHFRRKDYDEALESYSRAIVYCPEDDENKANLATFFGNRAAAYFALDEFELVIDDCTAAIELKNDYIKVIARRMQAAEKLEKYEDALADAKRLQELDPSYPKIVHTIGRLQGLYELKMNKMKDEALGKLKELGNSILGNFGMSLDNFKMNQDPATGSWNLSMNNNN